MKDFFSNLSMFAIVGVIMLCFLWIGIFFFNFGLASIVLLQPIVHIITMWSFALLLLVGLPLVAFRKTRPYVGVIVYLFSYLFALLLWTSAVVISYILIGSFWMFVGLVIVPVVGVIPLALLAALFKTEWILLYTLVFYMCTTIGLRLLGRYLIEQDETRKEEKSQVEQTPLA